MNVAFTIAMRPPSPRFDFISCTFSGTVPALRVTAITVKLSRQQDRANLELTLLLEKSFILVMVYFYESRCVCTDLVTLYVFKTDDFVRDGRLCDHE